LLDDPGAIAIDFFVIGTARPGRIKGQNILDEGQELFPVGKPEKRTDSAAYGTARIPIGEKTV
jgi:hypothetical protein